MRTRATCPLCGTVPPDSSNPYPVLHPQHPCANGLQCGVTGSLRVRALRVALPGGRMLIDGIDLTIGAGEVVVLLGGSGAGKSTFARVLFERDELDAAGFDVMAAEIDLDRGQLGLVPQRGALFDHL